MALYTGETCLICKNIFNENDDVVSCPECGTPYHRNCYKEKKRCVNEALHASHGSWMAENFTQKAADNNVHVCAKCGCPNSPEAESCRMCGTFLSEKSISDEPENSQGSAVFGDPEINEFFGFDANETMDSDNSITLGEMADYVKSNRFFYIISFKKLKDAAAKVSLNIIAFLIPEYFFASRKMYGWAAVAFVISFILGIPALMLELSSQDVFGRAFSEYFTLHPVNERLVDICMYVELGFRAVAGLAANALYYRHIISRLKKLRTASPDADVYRLRVRTEGGVSFVSMFVLFLVHFLSVLVFLAVMMTKIYL